MKKKTLVVVESPTKAKTIEKYLGNKKYTVMASMGHLRDLPKSQFGIDVENDFAPKYINIRGKGDLIKSLKKEAKKSEKVYLASDPDREGEAIAWHLSHILGIDEHEKCRIVFNEITKPAMANPRGSLNMPTMLNIAPNSQMIQPKIGMYPINRLMRARTNPAIPIPLLLLLPA